RGVWHVAGARLVPRHGRDGVQTLGEWRGDLVEGVVDQLVERLAAPLHTIHELPAAARAADTGHTGDCARPRPTIVPWDTRERCVPPRRSPSPASTSMPHGDRTPTCSRTLGPAASCAI